MDDIDPYGEWSVNEQNDDDVLNTEEDLVELERRVAEATKLDAMKEDKYSFEETIHHSLDTVAPSSSRPKNLSYIRRGKRKM